jgi:DNA replication and repair protein RecF
MQLMELECRGFRSLETLQFRPEPGLNVIRGGNAQGKTTVLEAILYVATSKSHRTTNENDLVQHGAEQFHVTAKARADQGAVGLEAHWWKGAKRFKVNGVTQARISDILGRMRVVFFSPEDVALVKEGAGGRRRFLDMELSQVDSVYLSALQQYRQVLRQRNELLRSFKADEDLIAVWDVQLAQHGQAIIQTRHDFIAQLCPLAAEAHGRIARNEALTLSYRPNIRLDEDLAQVFDRTRQGDMRRKNTTRGPHRDDMGIDVSGHPARSHGSQGQQRTAALALKLAELELVRQRTQEYPVLLLDEVLAELDAHRARELFKAIHDDVQAIVTTTDLETTQKQFGKQCALFQIERGQLAAT